MFLLWLVWLMTGRLWLTETQMCQISSHGRWLDIGHQEIHLYDDHGNDDDENSTFAMIIVMLFMLALLIVIMITITDRYLKASWRCGDGDDDESNATIIFWRNTGVGPPFKWKAWSLIPSHLTLCLGLPCLYRRPSSSPWWWWRWWWWWWWWRWWKTWS